MSELILLIDKRKTVMADNYNSMFPGKENDKTHEPEWTRKNSRFFSIDDIKDPEDIRNRQDSVKDPKVSIPSPFARFALMQDALKNVCNEENAYTRDKRLVSCMLDVAQLYYEGDQIEVFPIPLSTLLEDLKNNKASNLLGETLDLYIDRESFGFNKNFTLYLIKVGKQIVGATSPTSLFIPIPDTDKINDIKVGGKFKLFDKDYKKLEERDPEFVDYLYYLWGQIKKEIINHSSDFSKDNPLYNFDCYLSESDSDRFSKFVKDANKNDGENNDKYTPGDAYIYIQEADCQFQIPHRSKKAVSKSVESSDFIIRPEKKCTDTEDKTLPLVLSNNMKTPGLIYYGTEKWNSADFPVMYGEKKNKKLPWTNIEYEAGWLCEHDFLSRCLVRLPYKMNSNYYSFVEGETENAYLLPLTSTFFKYFDTDYLLENNKETGKHNLTIEKGKEQDGKEVITVTLYIPIKGGYIPLQKKYKASQSDNEPSYFQIVNGDSLKYEEQKRKEINRKVHAEGRLVDIGLSFTVFPFAKIEGRQDMKDMNLYYIQYGSNSSSQIRFECLSNKNTPKPQSVESNMYLSEEDQSPVCHKVSHSFDYFYFKIGEETDLCEAVEAVAIPNWGTPINVEDSSLTKFRFAIDFGTTNSFVAVTPIPNKDEAKDVAYPKGKFKLERSVVTSFDPDNKLEDNVAKTFLFGCLTAIKMRFVPLTIEEDYFPLRSVVIMPKNRLETDGTEPLVDINIPFFYGKEEYSRSCYKIASNIKWDENKKFAISFIEEFMLLCRAYVLENGGGLDQTELVWTYPLSMDDSAFSDFDSAWKKGYKKFFGESDNHVHSLSESVAPYLSCLHEPDKNVNIACKMAVSVDIGGGTTDIVFVDTQKHKEISSIKFAANVLFGGRPKDKAGNNPMIKKYYDEFTDFLNNLRGKRKFEGIKQKLSKLVTMLMKTCTDEVSPNSYAEANTTLFSLENQDVLKQNVALEDRSYNHKLAEDKDSRIIFIYFYALIIYYLVNVLKQNDKYTTPSVLLFSGTGSKVLNIVDKEKGTVLTRLTQTMLEFFSGDKYSYEEGTLDIVERDTPKELTARGALYINDDEAKIFVNPDKRNDYISKFRLVPDAKVEDLKQPEVIRKQILNKIDEFNNLFMKFIEENSIVSKYDCLDSSFDLLKSEFQDSTEIKAALDASIDEMLKRAAEKKERLNQPIPDDLFLVPIKNIVYNFINPKPIE